MKSSEPKQIWRPSGITIIALLLVIALMAAAAFFTGYGPWQQRQVTVQAEAREQEKRLPKMDVMRAERAGAKAELKLPGTMQAAVEVPILARIDGYLKSRTVDIGDHRSEEHTSELQSH